MVKGGAPLNIKKIKVGIRRIANAPATNVNLYYTTFDDTSTVSYSSISIPPFFLGTVSLPANGPSIVTSVVSLGDSVSTLFSIKADTGVKYTGYQTFFLGVSLDNPSPDNGIRLAAGPGFNVDTIWVHDVDSSAKRFAANFKGVPVATFNIEVFGASASLLPVTLSSFHGEQKELVNILKWSTENENNNKGFEVQRSADGSAFTNIGFVDTKTGNSALKKSYEFSDTEPLNENNYYRLKQVDNDGRFVISSVVLLKASKRTSVVLSRLYPNPAKSGLNLVINAPANNAGQILVTDVAGKAVIKYSTQLVFGNNNVSLNVARLLPGLYTVKVLCANGYETPVTQFVKQ
jgi:hypothetical protein